MRLDEALAKIGVVVVKQEARGDQVVLHLRVPPGSAVAWKEAAEAFLLDTGDWTSDVSKHLYPSRGVVKYLWRVVIGGNLAVGAQALGRALRADSRMPQDGDLVFLSGPRL